MLHLEEASIIKLV